jgi:hypothetical protein
MAPCSCYLNHAAYAGRNAPIVADLIALVSLTLLARQHASEATSGDHVRPLPCRIGDALNQRRTYRRRVLGIDGLKPCVEGCGMTADLIVQQHQPGYPVGGAA